jgi:glycosyltransferase involved in cell wall biosynthesis
LFPAEYHSDFHVLFDGIGCLPVRRGARDSRLVEGRTIPPGYRVVSFVARGLDRTRGFDRFVDLANRLLRSASNVLCIAIGSPIVQRGIDVDFYGKDYCAHVLDTTPLVDPDRFWLLGATNSSVVHDLLAISDLHVYPSRPYVVSRSMVEAMSAGCVVLGSNTEPVREFVEHNKTGLLVVPDDAEAWEREARAVLENPDAYRTIGANAAALVREKYSRDVTMPKLAALCSQLVQT